MLFRSKSYAILTAEQKETLEAKQAEMEGFGKPGTVAQPEPEMTYEEYDKYRNQLRLVDQRLDDLRTRAQGITNSAALQKLAQQEKQLLDARAGLEKLTAKPPLSPEQEVNKYQAKHKRLIDAFNTAKENGDIQAQARLAQQLYEHTGRTGEAALRLEEPPEQLSFAGALLARCAPGKNGMKVIEAIYKGQGEWFQDPEKHFRQYAKDNGINDAAFDACLQNKDLQQAMLDSITKAATEYHITSTPSFLVGDVLVEGETWEPLRDAIDKALGVSKS